AGGVARELEVLVGEAPLLGEEDEHDRALLRSRGLDRHREQRSVTALACDSTPFLVEALVVLEPGRREHAAIAGRAAQRAGRVAEASPEELHQHARQGVRTRE